MEPAYTTIQPGNLYPVGSDLMLDYNPNVSPALVRPMGAGGPRRGMQGFGAFGAVDVRPYVTFYTSAGAVPVAIDPTTVLSGNVIFPVVGAIPYDLDIIGWNMVLHVPYAGDVAVPLFGGGSGSSTVSIPGLGDVPYEVSIGPPAGALVPGGTFSASNLLSFAGSSILPLALIGVAAYFLLRK